MKIVSPDFKTFLKEIPLVGLLVILSVLIIVGIALFIPTLGWSWKITMWAFNNPKW